MRMNHTEPHTRSDPIVEEGFLDCIRRKGTSYSNPYSQPIEYNKYERGWMQALRQHHGNFPEISNSEEGKTYPLK